MSTFYKIPSLSHIIIMQAEDTLQPLHTAKVHFLYSIYIYIVIIIKIVLWQVIVIKHIIYYVSSDMS